MSSLSLASLDMKVYVVCKGNDIIKRGWKGVKHKLIFDVSQHMQKGITKSNLVPVTYRVSLGAEVY